jgi:hypothetical protein
VDFVLVLKIRRGEVARWRPTMGMIRQQAWLRIRYVWLGIPRRRSIGSTGVATGFLGAPFISRICFGLLGLNIALLLQFWNQFLHNLDSGVLQDPLDSLL